MLMNRVSVFPVIIAVLTAGLYGLLSFAVSQILDYILQKTTHPYSFVAHKFHMNIETINHTGCYKMKKQRRMK